MALFGVDLSDFDWGRGPVDVASMVRDGVAFVTHKFTEGVDVEHVHAGEAVGRAKAAGVRAIGGYHVVRSGPPVGAQVAHLLGYADRVAPWWRGFDGWFWQVDLEHWEYDQVSAGTGIAFARALKAAQPKAVVVYASRGQYGDSLTGVDAPLWNANYPTWRTDLRRCPAAPIAQAYADSGGDSGPGWAPYSGQTPVIWQFSDNATIGSQPGCDGNAFRGSIDQLLALIGAHTMSTLGDGQATDQLVTRIGEGVDPLYDATAPAGQKLAQIQPWWVDGNLKVLGARVKQLVADVAELKNRAPAALSDAQAHAIGDQVADAVVAHHDALTDADKPAIAAAVKDALRVGVGTG